MMRGASATCYYAITTTNHATCCPCALARCPCLSATCLCCHHAIATNQCPLVHNPCCDPTTFAVWVLETS